ncbi:GL20319 [Drosophila persimilis]|uniref:GL20319 n=1 Tax=Drosophila persimilis TaxID=7234 RepID=B4GXM5_DROPE|nr:GL20319 [Drosophila persimilis]
MRRTLWHMLTAQLLLLVLCSLLSLCSGGNMHPLKVGKNYVSLHNQPKDFRSLVMDITKFVLTIVGRTR